MIERIKNTSRSYKLMLLTSIIGGLFIPLITVATIIFFYILNLVYLFTCIDHDYTTKREVFNHYLNKIKRRDRDVVSSTETISDYTNLFEE